MTWQGLSGITNAFRATTLGLAPLSLRSGPSVLDRLKVSKAVRRVESKTLLTLLWLRWIRSTDPLDVLLVWKLDS